VTFARNLPLSVAWLIAAVALGLASAHLPLREAALAGATVVVVGLTVWRPAIGLGLAAGLGVLRAWLGMRGYASVIFDPGQVLLALTLAAWAGRRLLLRDPHSIPLPDLAWPLGVWTLVTAVSLLGAPSYEDGVNEVIKWGQMIVIAVIAVDESRRGDWPWLLASVLVAGALQGAIGILQHVGLADRFTFLGAVPESFALPGDRFRAYGSFEQPNPYGGYLGLLWPVAAALTATALLGLFESTRPGQRGDGEARRWPRLPPRLPVSALTLGNNLSLFALTLAAGLTTLLCLGGLYGSFSRGAWVGAVAAAAAMIVFWPRRLALGLGTGLLATGLAATIWAAGLLPASVAARLANVTNFFGVADVRGANINDENFAVIERLAHWQAAQAMIDAHPWLGVGIGNYAEAYDRYRLLNWPNALGHAHNIYLNVWAETGLVGIVTYFALWVSVLWVNIDALRRARGVERGLALGVLGSVVHLSVHHVFDNLYVNNIPFTIAILLGALNHVRLRSTPGSQAPAVSGAPTTD
jgi:O-antigen ligase